MGDERHVLEFVQADIDIPRYAVLAAAAVQTRFAYEFDLMRSGRDPRSKLPSENSRHATHGLLSAQRMIRDKTQHSQPAIKHERYLP